MTTPVSRADEVDQPAERHRLARRDFLKVAAATAAVGGVGVTPARVRARSAAPAVPILQTQETVLPLGNGEPPAVQFQAFPGGTGALMEKLWAEYDGNPFVRRPIAIGPWRGPMPATEEDVAFLPVHRLAALLREGRITSLELTDIYLERLRRLDPVLLCVVTFLEGRAREEAQQADREIAAGEWRGPLHGIPYGVKDLFSVRGARTTWGASDFVDQVIDEDAAVVERLRDAGAVLLAKLSTGAFAAGDNWYRGRTRNPWNLEQGSSGSSAGPASATAAGCVAFGIGSETQGSIVSPARRCGLSALRPTFGRVSRYGGMVLAWSMDKVGPLCRTVDDCALVFNAIRGADPRDPATLTAPFDFDRQPNLATMRIGYTDDAPESFVNALRDLGADPRPMPPLPDGRSNALSVESAAAFDFYVAPNGVLPPEPEPVESERRRRPRFRSGRDVSALDYVQAQRRRWIVMQEMATAMDGFDMFVSGSGHVRTTNQTGHPAVIVPHAFGSVEDGPPQPIGTTIVGDLFADDKILSVAHAYQTRTGWHTRRPRL